MEDIHNWGIIEGITNLFKSMTFLPSSSIFPASDAKWLPNFPYWNCMSTCITRILSFYFYLFFVNMQVLFSNIERLILWSNKIFKTQISVRLIVIVAKRFTFILIYWSLQIFVPFLILMSFSEWVKSTRLLANVGKIGYWYLSQFFCQIMRLCNNCNGKQYRTIDVTK